MPNTPPFAPVEREDLLPRVGVPDSHLLIKLADSDASPVRAKVQAFSLPPPSAATPFPSRRPRDHLSVPAGGGDALAVRV